MKAIAHTSSRAQTRIAPEDIIVMGLRLIGWFSTTLLATLGVGALAFFVLGGFVLDGTILQLDNLTSRFLAADAARREQFEGIVFGSLLIGFVMIGFFRRVSLFSAFIIGDER
jgi:hypothetical protein